MARHLLVTNDFPPKVGGIQSYLWELWRRLPPEETVVYCTPHDHAAAFDMDQPFRIERSPEPVLVPYPWLGGRITRLADDVGADLVMLDPALPLGLIGPGLGRPYGVVLHGAEVTIPGRLPGSRQALRRVLRNASLVVAAGDFALAEAEQCAETTLPSVVIPPGVDTNRFRPLEGSNRSRARQHFGFASGDVVIASVNRLVPRKGMDVLINAVADLAVRRPETRLVIGGAGRSEEGLRSLARDRNAPVSFLGRISDEDVTRLYGAADLMAMLCHDRWGGLEQEGFGIAFVEAASAGIPQVAGRSGGSAEAVVDGVTGFVVDQPRDGRAVGEALERLVADQTLRTRMGRAARARAVSDFDYDALARRLHAALRNWNVVG